MDDKWIATIWAMIVCGAASVLIVVALSYNALRAQRERHMADLIAQGGHPTLVMCAFQECLPATVMGIVAEIERNRRQ